MLCLVFIQYLQNKVHLVALIKSQSLEVADSSHGPIHTNIVLVFCFVMNMQNDKYVCE